MKLSSAPPILKHGGGVDCSQPLFYFVPRDSHSQAGSTRGIPSSPLMGNSVASIFPFLCPLHLLISLVTLVSLVSWVSRVSLVSLVSRVSLVSLVSLQVFFSQNTILKWKSCLDLGVNYLKPAFLLHQKLNT